MPSEESQSLKDALMQAHAECVALRALHFQSASARFHEDEGAAEVPPPVAPPEKPADAPEAPRANGVQSPPEAPPEPDAFSAGLVDETPVEDIDIPQMDLMFDSVITAPYVPDPRGEVMQPGTHDLEDFGLVGVALDGNQMLDTWFLLQAAMKWRTVARLVFDIERPGHPTESIALGTGFLVGPGVLMTNSHVLTAYFAKHAIAEFDHIKTPDDVTVPVQRHKLEPERLLIHDIALDYTLVAVAPCSDKGLDLCDRGWSAIDEEDREPAAGQRVNIVQHPNGEFQRVALRDNHVVPCRQTEFIHYLADTKTHSSGSPVWDDKWNLVALHHASVARHVDKDGNILYDEDGDPWDWNEATSHLVEWRANEGVSMHTIRADLETRALALPAGQQALIRGCFERPQRPSVENVHTTLTGLEYGQSGTDTSTDDEPEEVVDDVQAALRALGATYGDHDT